MLSKQPLFTTVLIAGTVDGLMGATEDNVSLALTGFVVAMASLLSLASRLSPLSRQPIRDHANVGREHDR